MAATSALAAPCAVSYIFQKSDTDAGLTMTHKCRGTWQRACPRDPGTRLWPPLGGSQPSSWLDPSLTGGGRPTFPPNAQESEKLMKTTISALINPQAQPRLSFAATEVCLVSDSCRCGSLCSRSSGLGREEGIAHLRGPGQEGCLPSFPLINLDNCITFTADECPQRAGVDHNVFKQYLSGAKI